MSMGSFLITRLIDRLREYIRLKGEQIKLRVVKHLAKLMGHLVAIILLLFFAFFMFLFLNFALALYLNNLIESDYAGYLLVGAIYFVVFIILALLVKTKRLQGWVESAILKATEQNELTEDEDD
jgi:hypothetical protein